jgi:hypothetical protein
MINITGKSAGAGMILVLSFVFCTAGAEQFYRWVDQDGVVHYGDRIPPEYAKNERQVVNDHGVTVELLAAEKSEEELDVERRQIALAEQEQHEIEAARERDSVLLNTYLTVSEIETLRDSRIELIKGQIQITEINLQNLRQKLAKLQKEALHFRPYNADPTAPPIQDNLAKELSNTLNSIFLYEKNLGQARTKETQLVAKFDADIDRFRTLKNLN